MEDRNSIVIDIEYIIKYLKSDRLSENDEKLLSKLINRLNIDELLVFKQLAEQFKYNKKYLGWNKYKITKNAIILADKIFNCTEIKVFPYIEAIARKGWSLSNGTFAWGMYQLENYPSKQIYSDRRVQTCLKKSNELEFDIYNRFDFINIKPTK